MKKIMIVDDEQDVQALYQQRFRRELRAGELEFHFAFSAQDALEYLEHNDVDQIALVLSDINMPGMSGLELLKQAKEKFTKLKVIMITAYNDSTNYETAVKYGSDDYFTKPVDFNALRDRLLSS